MMRIRTVKPQIILIACLVIIHYLSAPSTREGESVCVLSMYCMCVLYVCLLYVSVSVCVLGNPPDTHKPLFTQT